MHPVQFRSKGPRSSVEMPNQRGRDKLPFEIVPTPTSYWLPSLAIFTALIQTPGFREIYVDTDIYLNVVKRLLDRDDDAGDNRQSLKPADLTHRQVADLSSGRQYQHPAQNTNWSGRKDRADALAPLANQVVAKLCTRGRAIDAALSSMERLDAVVARRLSDDDKVRYLLPVYSGVLRDARTNIAARVRYLNNVLQYWELQYENIARHSKHGADVDDPKARLLAFDPDHMKIARQHILTVFNNTLDYVDEQIKTVERRTKKLAHEVGRRRNHPRTPTPTTTDRRGGAEQSTPTPEHDLTPAAARTIAKAMKDADGIIVRAAVGDKGTIDFARQYIPTLKDDGATVLALPIPPSLQEELSQFAQDSAKAMADHNLNQLAFVMQNLVINFRGAGLPDATNLAELAAIGSRNLLRPVAAGAYFNSLGNVGRSDTNSRSDPDYLQDDINITGMAGGGKVVAFVPNAYSDQPAGVSAYSRDDGRGNPEAFAINVPITNVREASAPVSAVP